MKAWLHFIHCILAAFAWLPLATARDTFPIAPVASLSNATVTVNHLAASRHGEYWHRALGVDNDADAAYAAIQAVAVRNDYGEDDEDIVDETTGHAFVPQNPEGLFYDADGNVGADGRWAYSWDGENRLIGMEAWEDLPAGARRKLAFSYDWQGRRTAKVTYDWNTSTNGYEQVSGERFVYDGWNLIGRFDTAPSLTLKQSFMWGSDLSGSLSGAGGVGRLLTVFDWQLETAHFAAYDGNGNVTALVDTSGATTATYEYSPFGVALRVEGEAARANPFRFSSKFTDDETGLLYYGYRFYSPTLGRWISRDPLGEEGGLNLYGFILNSPVNGVDIDGRSLLTGGLTTAYNMLSLNATTAIVLISHLYYNDYAQRQVDAEQAALQNPGTPQYVEGLFGFGTLFVADTSGNLMFLEVYQNAGITYVMNDSLDIEVFNEMVIY